MRSRVDEVSSFAQGSAYDTRNACFVVEVRRVDDHDANRDREVAKLVEHADRGVVTATDDRHDHEQVDVGIGAVITASDRAVEDNPAGTAALDNPVGDP